MSTLATIAYVHPDQYVHVADDLAAGTICVEVSDGVSTTRVDLSEHQARALRDGLNARFPD